MPANLEKLNSGHRTGKGQFSSQSQRKAMPTNAQNSTSQASQYMNHELQMFKLNLEKAEEPETKLPTSTIIEKAREFQKKSISLTTPKPLTV